MSNLRRFFVNKVEDINQVCGDEFKHAVSVLRLNVGDQIILCDNSGIDYVCEISTIDKKGLSARLLREDKNEAECKNEVVLITGFLKGDKTELVVQKAVELGVRRIVIFDSEFSSAYMSENKLLRLNKVSMEAAKQCGRSICPEVIYCKSFLDALNEGVNCKNRFIAYENKTNYSKHMSKMSGSTAVVIGSEGGFSMAEIDKAHEVGYEVVSLGKRILRAETACIAIIAVVMHELGELE